MARGRKPKISYAVADNLRFRYQDNAKVGSKTLLFLHGLGGSIEGWVNNVVNLSSKYRTIVFDLPGFGLSDKPNRNYTIGFFSSFVLHAIQELGVGLPINVIGSSLGGQIAANIAITSPHIVTKLILISPAGFTPRSFLSSCGLRKYAGIIDATSRLQVKKALSQTAKSEDTMDKDADVVLKRMALPGAKNAFTSSLKYSTSARRLNAHRIKSHTLVIWGKEDRIIPIKFVHPFMTMRNCRLLLLEDCGHRPHAEKPIIINRIIKSFIEEN